MKYLIDLPWGETIKHEQLIYLSEDEGVVTAVYEVNNVVLDFTSKEWYKKEVHDVTKFFMAQCHIQRLRPDDAARVREEVGLYEDNLLEEVD